MPNHFNGHVKFTAKVGSKGAAFIKDKFPEVSSVVPDTDDRPGDNEFFAHIGDPCSSQELPKDSGDWYEMNLRKWGSKWGAYDARYIREENDENVMLTIHYTSAWCAPDRGFYRFAVKYDLTFEGWGEEPGCGFITHYNNAGTLTFEMPDREHLTINYGVFKDQEDGWYLEDEDSEDEDAGYLEYSGDFLDWYVGQVVKGIQPAINGQRGAEREAWFDDFKGGVEFSRAPKQRGHDLEKCMTEWNALFV